MENPERDYSIEEASWLVEKVREQKGWSYMELAEAMGVGERFMRRFRTGERTSHPIYKRLAELYKKPPKPPKPPKLKLEVRAYLAEDESPGFFKNIGKHLPRITKGTIPHRSMQGDPVQLTLEDFMKFEEKKGDIKESFATWLVDTAEEALQSFYGSTKPLKGKSKIARKFDEQSDIVEGGYVDDAISALDEVEEEYQPTVFRIAGERSVTLEEFDNQITESGEFFQEREEYKKKKEEEEYMTYTRAYLKELGLTSDEIEKYRIVRGEIG